MQASRLKTRGTVYETYLKIRLSSTYSVKRWNFIPLTLRKFFHSHFTVFFLFFFEGVLLDEQRIFPVWWICLKLKGNSNLLLQNSSNRYCKCFQNVWNLSAFLMKQSLFFKMMWATFVFVTSNMSYLFLTKHCPVGGTTPWWVSNYR